MDKQKDITRATAKSLPFVTQACSGCPHPSAVKKKRKVPQNFREGIKKIASSAELLGTNKKKLQAPQNFREGIKKNCKLHRTFGDE
jgi:biotin synthase-related radical SAM superfamily protein